MMSTAHARCFKMFHSVLALKHYVKQKKMTNSLHLS